MKIGARTLKTGLAITLTIFLVVGDISHANINLFKRYRRAINAVQSNLDRLMALPRGIVFMHGGSKYSKLRQELYEYLQYLLALHKKIYDCIVFNKGYQKVEKDINAEEIRKKIVGFIKTDSNDNVFEFYNIYFEATRINEKLEQLKNEFALDFCGTD